MAILSMDTKPGHDAWKFSKDMQHRHVHAVWACNMDVQRRKKVSVDMKHGHSARTFSDICSINMSAPSARTGSMDKQQDMQYEHAAQKCTTDMHHRHATWTWVMDKQHEQAEVICSMYMFHGHAAWTCSIEKQHRNSALTCTFELQQGSVAWTCGMDMRHGHST
jgi:hypothetical protein